MSLRKLWPRRALFYTPGSDLRKMSKIEKLVGVSAPDFVAVDIEDGVAMTAKVPFFISDPKFFFFFSRMVIDSSNLTFAT